MFDMYGIPLRKTAEPFGQTRTRQISDQAIENLQQQRRHQGAQMRTNGVKTALLCLCPGWTVMMSYRGGERKSRASHHHN